MAVSKINAGYVPTGTYNLIKSVFAGETTSSGNYMYFFIPGRFSKGNTITLSLTNAEISTEASALGINDIDTTYNPVLDITPFGIRVEMKFKSTKPANKPITIHVYVGTLTIA